MTENRPAPLSCQLPYPQKDSLHLPPIKKMQAVSVFLSADPAGISFAALPKRLYLFSVFSVPRHPQPHAVWLPPLCPGQLPPEGQPIHLVPFFFSFTIYATALPTRISKMPPTIKFAIVKTSCLKSNDYACRLYSAPNSFSFLRISITRIAANTATTIRPGTNPVPIAPVVISVPIWYTRKATV